MACKGNFSNLVSCQRNSIQIVHHILSWVRNTLRNHNHCLILNKLSLWYQFVLSTSEHLNTQDHMIPYFQNLQIMIVFMVQDAGPIILFPPWNSTPISLSTNSQLYPRYTWYLDFVLERKKNLWKSETYSISRCCS